MIFFHVSFLSCRLTSSVEALSQLYRESRLLDSSFSLWQLAQAATLQCYSSFDFSVSVILHEI